MKRLTFALAALALSACTDPEGALRVAEGAGYKDVKITGFRWTGCGEHDDYSTGFEATDQRGRRITGVVCASGWFFGKSSTLRID